MPKLEFQVHKGSIKTCRAVRKCHLYFSFNSIKVRLRRRYSRPLQFLFPFQFHKGSIKTEELAPGYFCDFRFNSIKVRLRLCKITFCVHVDAIFNSIKVRLRLLSVVFVVNLLFNFNSIKVRLRPVYSSTKQASETLFQFHKGSIKTQAGRLTEIIHDCFNSIKVRLRLRMSPVELKKLTFQFHKGSIKTIRQHHRPPRTPPFQFHKGSIKT